MNDQSSFYMLVVLIILLAAVRSIYSGEKRSEDCRCVAHRVASVPSDSADSRRPLRAVGTTKQFQKSTSMVVLTPVL